MAVLPDAQRLKVATIYSFGVNEDADGFIIDENPEDTSGLDRSSRDFLESAIVDYNAMFGTSYDTSSDKFQNYYKDVSLRMKNRELDLLIVVNMFLTGFDATTLNTLWVDKNPELHQDVRQHRMFPQPRNGYERKPRPVRRQGGGRHRAAQNLR